jgi:hypothetical protein
MRLSLNSFTPANAAAIAKGFVFSFFTILKNSRPIGLHQVTAVATRPPKFCLHSFIPAKTATIANRLLSSFFAILKNSKPLEPPRVISIVEIKPEISKFVLPSSLHLSAGCIVFVAASAAAYVISRYFSSPSSPPPPENRRKIQPTAASLDDVKDNTPASSDDAEEGKIPLPAGLLQSCLESPASSAASAVDGVTASISNLVPTLSATDFAGVLPPLDIVTSPALPIPSPSPVPLSENPPEVKSASSQGSPPRRRPSPPVVRFSKLAVLKRAIFANRHFSKWMKYREVLSIMERFVSSSGIEPIACGNTETPIDKIAAAWNTLHTTLTNPSKFKTADQQYSTTVDTLRDLIGTLLSSTQEIKILFADQLKFCMQLSYLRFAGIEFFNYCRDLVELGTGMELPRDLSLDSFFNELNERAKHLNHPAEELNMNFIAREWKKFKGSANIYFDPLIGDNVPYLDGMLMIKQQKIRILRHGVPFYHHDPVELAKHLPLLGTLVDWASRMINWFSPKSESVEPIVNPDYIAFIMEAKEKGERILQVILENGHKKGFGDESARVKARLKLGNEHENFFPLALNLDGELFEHFSDQEAISDLQTRFQRLLIPEKNGRSPEESLESTGYCIPEKILRESQLAENLGGILDEVRILYFPEMEKITSIEQHQAFIILSYVHIILFLCCRLNVNILEAFCKDDIDRGNVIKTILKLVFLYLSRNTSPENLNAVLVNTLAAPFIVKKQAIISSRLRLIERVIPFITAASRRNPTPKTALFGEDFSGNYYVFSLPDQSIYPQGSTGKNLEEYQAFWDSGLITAPSFDENFLEEIADPFYSQGHVQKQLLKERISERRESFNLQVGDKLLKPPVEVPIEELYRFYETEIVEALRLKGLSEEAAWKVACCMQPGLSEKIQDRIGDIFDNPYLKFFVRPDIEAMKKPDTGISVSVKNEVASVTCNLMFKIIGENCLQATFPRLKAKLVIPDHRTGKAQFDLEVIKTLSH